MQDTQRTDDDRASAGFADALNEALVAFLIVFAVAMVAIGAWLYRAAGVAL